MSPPDHEHPPVPDGPWAHRLGHLLWEVSAMTTMVVETDLAPLHLTSRKLGILDKIAAAPGSTIADLARHSPVTQQAVSQTVARLEQHGGVKRRLGSGRGVGLYLTQAGSDLRERGNRSEQRTEDELRRRLGDDLFQTLTTALEAARDRLADPVSQRPPSEKETPS